MQWEKCASVSGSTLNLFWRACIAMNLTRLEIRQIFSFDWTTEPCLLIWQSDQTNDVNIKMPRVRLIFRGQCLNRCLSAKQLANWSIWILNEFTDNSDSDLSSNSKNKLQQRFLSFLHGLNEIAGAVLLGISTSRNSLSFTLTVVTLLLQLMEVRLSSTCGLNKQHQQQVTLDPWHNF